MNMCGNGKLIYSVVRSIAAHDLEKHIVCTDARIMTVTRRRLFNIKYVIMHAIRIKCHESVTSTHSNRSVRDI